MRRIEDNSFVLLLIVATIAFGWVISPFLGAVLWAVIVAIVFAPLYEDILVKMPRHPNSAAALALLIIMALVILPAILLAAVLLQEVMSLYVRIQSGAIDPAAFFLRLQANLPATAQSLLNNLGLGDLDAVQARATEGLQASMQSLALRILGIGQSALGFLVSLAAMLYLAFFLLRDGKKLVQRLENTVPLAPVQRSALLEKFTIVIRATIKGTLVVAIVQGTVGGLIFWMIGISSPLLWGVLMAFMSLLPAVGTGIVWLPVALWLLATGDVWQGVVLIICGVGIIGLVDNLLRPILVGREARLPDYLVLITTLGGLQLIGFNGLVVGPVIAGMFVASWEIFGRTRRVAVLPPPDDKG